MDDDLVCSVEELDNELWDEWEETPLDYEDLDDDDCWEGLEVRLFIICVSN